MKTIITFFIAMILLSCNELKFDNEFSLPIVKMDEVSEIDETGVTLKAYVNHIGSENILRGSFNWYPKGKKITIEEDRFLIDVEVENREWLSIRLNRDLVAGVEYEARFVVELENGKVYSPTVSFFSKGALSEPIKILNKFSTRGIGNSRSVMRQGLGKIFYNDNSNTPENSQILLYNEKDDFWESQTIEMGGNFVSSIFKGTREFLLGYGRLSNSNFYLWKINGFNSEIQEIGKFNFPDLRHSISFIINDKYYGNTLDWQLSFFDINDYDGVEMSNPLPFPSNAVKYYSFQVGNKGYVFFSDKKESIDDTFSSNQLWEFDSSTFNWKKLNSFPGTGKDFFSVSTDNNRFIYIVLERK